MNIEHGTFAPLIFALNGGVGPEWAKFHQHLADQIASKSDDRYETFLSWIRCKLSFIILRASLLCIRGSRSHIVKQNIAVVNDFEFACQDARLRDA